MRRIDFDAPDVAGASQFDDAPVEPCAAPALGFPAVAHVLRLSGHDQIVPVPEKHIARLQHRAAVLGRRQIDLAVAFCERIPVGHDLAVNAEARHAAVRVNFQTQVRGAVFVIDPKRIFRVARELRVRQNFRPDGARVEQLFNCRLTVDGARFERAVRRKIAAKKRRIDDDAADDSGQSETNDAPIEFFVETRAAAAARFPAVHPFAQIRVFALDKNGRGGFQKIFFRREKLVVGDEHRAAELFGR